MQEHNKRQLSWDSDHDIALWDEIAKNYSAFIEKGDVYRKQLADPVVFRWLGTVFNKHVLDAGCGEGYLAHELAKRGARAVGIDGSRELTRIANNKYANPALQFQYHDLRDSLPFKTGTFHAIVSHFSLMDFNPIEKAIAEFSRVLKKRGECIISILHPALASGELKKTIKERVFHRPPHMAVSHYSTPRKRMQYIQGAGKKVAYYHRPIEYYIKLLTREGLFLKDIEEPVFRKEFIKGKNNFIKLRGEVPIFLLLRTEKK